jgi:hypothetical protein
VYRCVDTVCTEHMDCPGKFKMSVIRCYTVGVTDNVLMLL